MMTTGTLHAARADWQVTPADVEKNGHPDITVEGPLLKATVSSRGGGLVSFFDKIRNHEEAKTFPAGNDDGLNQLRISGVANDADTAWFALTQHAGENGSLRVEAAGDVTLTINEERVGPMHVLRTYIFEPDAARVRVVTRFENGSTQTVNFVPWIKHLLHREGAEPTRIAFMTPYGVYDSNNPIPGRGGQMFQGNVHYMTASNWISQTRSPIGATTNTLASVASPQRLFKVYAWKKPSEDFVTQEFILAPRVLSPGQSDEFTYFLTLTSPLPAPAYVSPLLNLDVTPHPMGIPAATRELTLRAAATRALGDVEASGELKRLDATEAPQPVHLHFAGLTPAGAATSTAPVQLAPKGRYILQLNLTAQGKALLPGAEIGDNDPVRIPLVADDALPQTISYPSRVGGGELFPRLKPQQIAAPLAGNGKSFTAFRLPATQRVFEADVIRPNARRAQPVQLEAGANEFHSFQLVLTGTAHTVVAVEASPLRGKGNTAVAVDRVSRFLYAETKVPSGYNPNYGLGRYPDGLLETKDIEVEPGITAPLYITYHVPPATPPGEYHGQIVLKAAGETITVPVVMRVWNFELPVRPALDVIADPKAGGNAAVPVYFRYKVTPAFLPVSGLLTEGNFAEVERQMPSLIAQGMSRTYLGMTRYLLEHSGPERIKAMDAFLKAHGWVNYFYVRPGYDEASSDKVDDIKQTAQAWKSLSSIPVMETYYYDEKVDQLFGSIDIYSRGFSKAAWIQQRMQAGDEFWRVNAFPGSLENPPRDTWARYLAMADYNFTGTYIWTLTAFRETEWGKDWWADDGVANLSATLLWKNNGELLPSIRLESLRDAIEAYSLYDMLKKRVAQPQSNDNPQLLQRARALLGDPPLWQRIKSDDDIDKIHRAMGEVLSGLNS